MDINELTKQFEEEQRKAFEIINRRKRIKKALKHIEDIAYGRN